MLVFCRSPPSVLSLFVTHLKWSAAKEKDAKENSLGIFLVPYRRKKKAVKQEHKKAGVNPGTFNRRVTKSRNNVLASIFLILISGI